MAALDHFAIMSIARRHFTNAFIVRLSTNNPVHLSLYYTPEKPLKHKVERIQRGLATMWGAYFCFVGWKFIPQIEAGDTLDHTFIVPDQSYLSRLWYTFRGTIAGELSPSCGPIIEHLQPAGDIILNPSFEDWTILANPPDNWLASGSPGIPTDLKPNTEDKTDGLQSLETTVNVLYALSGVYQNLDPAYLSDLQLTFRVAYKGDLEWRNTLRIRAWGDTMRLVLARPTLSYQWENLDATITMPSNLYRLEIRCLIDHQGQPLPWWALWDNCQVYLGIPP